MDGDLQTQLNAALGEQDRLRTNLMQYVERAADMRDSVVRMRERLKQQRAKIVELELLVTARDQELRDQSIEHEAYIGAMRDTMNQLLAALR